MSIISDIFDRAAAISGLTTSVNKPRSFHEHELPGMSVYLGGIEIEDIAQGPSGYLLNQTVIIKYHKTASDDPTADAVQMISDIRAAVELESDPYLVDSNGQAQLCSPLQFDGTEQPDIPDDGGEVVAVTVLYLAIYTSPYGG